MHQWAVYLSLLKRANYRLICLRRSLLAFVASRLDVVWRIEAVRGAPHTNVVYTIDTSARFTTQLLAVCTLTSASTNGATTGGIGWVKIAPWNVSRSDWYTTNRTQSEYAQRCRAWPSRARMTQTVPKRACGERRISPPNAMFLPSKPVTYMLSTPPEPHTDTYRDRGLGGLSMGSLNILGERPARRKVFPCSPPPYPSGDGSRSGPGLKHAGGAIRPSSAPARLPTFETT